MGMGIAAGACRGGDGRGWRRRSGRAGEVRHSPSSATWPPAAARRRRGFGCCGGWAGTRRFRPFESGFTWTGLESQEIFLRSYKKFALHSKIYKNFAPAYIYQILYSVLKQLVAKLLIYAINIVRDTWVQITSLLEKK